MITNLQDRVDLNNGARMPWLGLGTFRIEDGPEVERAVGFALETGYRGIDTAAAYENERGVGRAIRDSGVPREEIFLTTKVWNTDQRERRTLAAFDESLDRLGLEYVDLYLVHWPVKGLVRETWKAMEEIFQSGRARAIGVSNFLIHHLEDLLGDCQVVPAVNQVEFHPYLLQQDLLDFCREQGVQVEGWSPLMKGRILDHPLIQSLAEKYDKTAAQITLRWALQHRVVAIPKSVHTERIAENSRLFDFALSEEDLEAIDGLDRGQRVGPDPDDFDF